MTATHSSLTLFIENVAITASNAQDTDWIVNFYQAGWIPIFSKSFNLLVLLFGTSFPIDTLLLATSCTYPKYAAKDASHDEAVYLFNSFGPSKFAEQLLAILAGKMDLYGTMQFGVDYVAWYGADKQSLSTKLQQSQGKIDNPDEINLNWPVQILVPDVTILVGGFIEENFQANHSWLNLEKQELLFQDHLAHSQSKRSRIFNNGNDNNNNSNDNNNNDSKIDKFGNVDWLDKMKDRFGKSADYEEPFKTYSAEVLEVNQIQARLELSLAMLKTHGYVAHLKGKRMENYRHVNELDLLVDGNQWVYFAIHTIKLLKKWEELDKAGYEAAIKLEKWQNLMLAYGGLGPNGYTILHHPQADSVTIRIKDRSNENEEIKQCMADYDELIQIAAEQSNRLYDEYMTTFGEAERLLRNVENEGWCKQRMMGMVGKDENTRRIALLLTSVNQVTYLLECLGKRVETIAATKAVESYDAFWHHIAKTPAAEQLLNRMGNERDWKHCFAFAAVLNSAILNFGESPFEGLDAVNGPSDWEKICQCNADIMWQTGLPHNGSKLFAVYGGVTFLNAATTVLKQRVCVTLYCFHFLIAMFV